MKQKEQNLYFATWLRTAATISILLCHYTQENGSAIFKMSAQFFNIGVPLFIILSGFLFGVRGGADVLSWYTKRIKRIYVPYELFVVCLFAVHSVLKLDVLNVNWLWLLFGLQGSVVGVKGAEQTWFITALLLCYLATPMISRFAEWTGKDENHLWRLIAITSVLPILWALVPPAFVSTLVDQLSWYTLAFLYGRNYDRVFRGKKYAWISFLTICAAFSLRILTRFLADGTILYDRIIVVYTHAIAAFAIFYIFSVAFERVSPNAVIVFISTVSFEIYLYHYMFVVGPLRLFGCTGSWVLDSLLITAITIMISACMNRISKLIMTSL